MERIRYLAVQLLGEWLMWQWTRQDIIAIEQPGKENIIFGKAVGVCRNCTYYISFNDAEAQV